MFTLNNENVRTAALQVVSTETRRVTLAALRAADGLPARTAVEDGTDATRIVFIILNKCISGRVKTESFKYSHDPCEWYPYTSMIGCVDEVSPLP
jgi:hypothetical protein